MCSYGRVHLKHSINQEFVRRRTNPMLNWRRGEANGAASRRCGRPSGRRGGTGAVRGVAWQPSRMLKNARVSEREGQSDLQIASENGCWLSWRQVGGKADEAALACP